MALADRPDGDLLHVGDALPAEHRAALGQRDDGDGVGQALGEQGGAVDRVHGDVGLGRQAVADPLAGVEHRRLVLLALADDDDAVHVDGVQGEAHGVDGGLVGGDLVALAHPAGGREGGGLGDAGQLEGEVPVEVGAGRASTALFGEHARPPRRRPSVGPIHATAVGRGTRHRRLAQALLFKGESPDIVSGKSPESACRGDLPRACPMRAAQTKSRAYR